MSVNGVNKNEGTFLFTVSLSPVFATPLPLPLQSPQIPALQPPAPITAVSARGAETARFSGEASASNLYHSPSQ